jgi:predicted NBD/HSP70 family sugar kinase
MPTALRQLAHRLLIEGDELTRTGMSLTRYYQHIDRSPSSVATATAELGMSRADDKVRALVTGNHRKEAALAFGPSAGLVLGVSLGATSLRAALVDANGVLHNVQEGPELMGQLAASPHELFERIRVISERVLDEAFENPRLLVSRALPFLGVAVAWPAPLDTEKVPRSALSHREWRSNDHDGIHLRLGRHLHVRERSHALNDASAATLAVAFDHSRRPDYRKQRYPQLILVVRLGGGLGASSIVVEPVKDGDVSGWMNSRLTEGHRGLAGEIGHTPVDEALLRSLKTSRPRGCPALKRVQCSCAEGGAHPDHVEACTSGAALAARFSKARETPNQAVARVLGDQSAKNHRRALEETGMLLGDALLPSVLMLNPYRIVLTGRLATEAVREGLEVQLATSEALGGIFGGIPEVLALQGEDNHYIRVRGAALAVLREHLHRRFDELYGAPKGAVRRRFTELTEPITAYPWA